ncbi:DsbC family protein [Sphingobium chungbukense]|uniref:Thiol:disulfide interchange protein n=1 Tax=Sphingobium chungbukense TaxID=56193 RepID=A0A0M3ANQ4_9SPHN|nr:DsbC family protein [Sphingobium chungbukense]KKW90169.1 protein-disulfide isomerase [Sphingobium chungbukense]
MKRLLILMAAFAAAHPLPSIAEPSLSDGDHLERAREAAEKQLHQSFTNLSFEDFALSPVRGPIYQASAGGRILYYAPDSDHVLFATVYDRNGVNITALSQNDRVRRQLSAIDQTQALTLGPQDAPTVIEFTDPDCPYCRALDQYWKAKAAEGRPVRRLIFFVSGIHPQAAAKAEHILCSADQAAAFRATYEGAPTTALKSCAKGKAKVEADAALVRKLGVGGTPSLIFDGQLISGFQQAELDAFLARTSKAKPPGS